MTEPIAEEKFKFIGSGSEYFRIWIVNIFLNMITFGIYGPWAKVRRQKYFAQNTQFVGHGFDYHAEPKALLKGSIVALPLLLIVAGYAGPIAMAFGFILLIGITPWVVQRSFAFRANYTSYRGLRFRFSGTRQQAYRLSMTWLGALIATLIVAGLAIWSQLPDGLGSNKDVPNSVGIIAVIAVLMWILVFYPWMVFLWQKFRLSHSYFGSVASRPQFTLKGFIRLTLKAWVGVVLIGIGFAALLFFVISAATHGGTPSAAMFGALGVLVLAIPLTALLIFNGLRAYLLANFYRYSWREGVDVVTESGLELSHFTCDLRPISYVMLSMKNTLLTFITLGLYRPFATVSEWRMKVESVGLTRARFVDFVVSRESEKVAGYGEEIGENLGIDLGI